MNVCMHGTNLSHTCTRRYVNTLFFLIQIHTPPLRPAGGRLPHATFPCPCVGSHPALPLSRRTDRAALSCAHRSFRSRQRTLEGLVWLFPFFMLPVISRVVPALGDGFRARGAIGRGRCVPCRYSGLFPEAPGPALWTSVLLPSSNHAAPGTEETEFGRSPRVCPAPPPGNLGISWSPTAIAPRSSGITRQLFQIHPRDPSPLLHGTAGPPPPLHKLLRASKSMVLYFISTHSSPGRVIF